MSIKRFSTSLAARCANSTGSPLLRIVSKPRQSFRQFTISASYHEYIVPLDSTASSSSSSSSSSKYRIGISDYAAKALGDVVYIELPEPNLSFNVGDTIGALESVKTASDLIAPAKGTVLAVNKELNEQPGFVAEDAEGKGWIAEVEVENLSEELMNAEEYKAFLDGEGGKMVEKEKKLNEG